MGAEVARVLAQRGAKELRPKAVHDDAGGERVLAGDEPLGEVEAVRHAAFEFGLRQVVGQGGLHFDAGLIHPIAAGQDADGADDGGLGRDERLRDGGAEGVMGLLSLGKRLALGLEGFGVQ